MKFRPRLSGRSQGETALTAGRAASSAAPLPRLKSRGATPTSSHARRAVWALSKTSLQPARNAIESSTRRPRERKCLSSRKSI
nr:MAG TPA: hypothetical protein [Caudoviricetes sp.]